jgi:hypothetical protein
LRSERISVELRPSRRLLLAMTGAHLAAGLVLSLAFEPGLLVICGLLAVAASLAWLVIRGLRQVQAQSLEIVADGTCLVRRRDGLRQWKLRVDSTVLPWLVILRLADPGERRTGSLVLCPDSMAHDDWRRLRVFLRWGVRFVDAAPAPSGEPY